MSETSRQIQGVIVEIFGDEYQIAVGDHEHVQKIAEYVDGKMREIAAAHSGRIPQTKLAVLAAMTITDELFRLLNEQSTLTEKAQEKLQRLNRLVEERASLSSAPEVRRTSPVERLLKDQPERRREVPAVE